MDRHDSKYDPRDIESVRELYDFLQGRTDCGITNFPDAHRPNLTGEQAWHVIYMLQEHMGLLPDHYEKCRGGNCDAILDTECEGRVIDDDSARAGTYCDDCACDLEDAP